MKNNYNLLDEEWILLANGERAGLLQAFAAGTPWLAGTPYQKLAVFKLLCAIAQAAWTPADEDEWYQGGAAKLAQRACEYLESHRGRFFLYGDRPFLQLPQVRPAIKKDWAALQPQKADGNNPLFWQTERLHNPSDAERAGILLQQMNFSLGGKKIDKTVVLSRGHVKKSGPAGSSVSFKGLLHSLFHYPTLLSSVYLNLLTCEEVRAHRSWEYEVGTPPWERMPEGEEDEVARRLQASLQGRLVALGRFCLLDHDGVHYTGGIQHPDYKAGEVDPTVTCYPDGKKAKVLWADPERRPWRQLPRLLVALGGQGSGALALNEVRMSRLRTLKENFHLYCGGLSLTSNAGEQYTTGEDDFVESDLSISVDLLTNTAFTRLNEYMAALEKASGRLYACSSGYAQELGREGGKRASPAGQFAEKVSAHFWQSCELQLSVLLDLVGSEDAAHAKKAFAALLRRHVQQSYDRHCAHDTARQLCSWVKHRPTAHTLEQLAGVAPDALQSTGKE